MFKRLFRKYKRGQRLFYMGDKNFGIVIVHKRGFGKYVVAPFSYSDRVGRSLTIMTRWELTGYE